MRIVQNMESKMRILRSLCLAVCFTVSAFGQNEVRKPPSITKEPKPSEIFRVDNRVELECKAEGIPAVTYVWKMNGEDLNFNRPNIRRGADGDLIINPATMLDEGFYQCFASNQFGIALSIMAHIQSAFLETTSQSNIVPMTVQEGRPFVIPAAQRKSVPKPTYNWEIATSSVDSSPRPLHPSNRMQIACNGDLYFAYAKKEDGLDGNIYKSTAYNPNMDVKSGGSYTRVTVTNGSEPLPEFAPNISYSSVSRDVALIGGSVTLKCFFSANPTPQIQWTGPGDTISPRRSVKSNFGTEITISNIIEADEGDFICTATNSKGSYEHTLRIRVEAVPAFNQNFNGPINVNVTEGESVAFNCSPTAKPQAVVVWLLNGQPIDVNNAPARFAFSKDKTRLTIRDVCRDCKDRESQTDLMVIQCNASNVHGYTFASGYLNVLRKTKVSITGQSFEPVDLTKENHFQVNCSATSDPITPPTIQWRWMGPKGWESVHNVTPYVYLMNGILTINTDRNCSDACAKYLGEYRCVGDNGYSQDIATVTFNGTGQMENAMPTKLNWIFIAIAIACLLLLLILLCCIICKYNKGDEYDVDSKERKSGSNPEKEIQDCGFQDYYPRGYEKITNSRETLGSANSLKGIDDVANEYDDDEGGFREDGSFVGKYNDRPL